MPSTRRAAASTSAAWPSEGEKITRSRVTVAPSVATISMPMRLPPTAPMAVARVPSTPGVLRMRARRRIE
jgi:hypothetical protein